MDELKIIENELVPVYQTDSGEKVVYGTELHKVLGVKSNYRDWVKNRLNDCEAVENEDFQTFAKNLAKGRPAQEHIIKLDTAKEMAMLERNDRGKQVRRYFIEIEKKYRQPKVPVTIIPPAPNPIQDLSPQLQFLINMELKQKEMDKELSELKSQASKQNEAIQTVKDAMASADIEQDFSKWVIASIKKIAESKSFEDDKYRYQSVWSESYKRLTNKAGCNLELQLKNAKARALKNGATKAQVKNISKLSIISGDKKLKELYIASIKEMMVAYCVEVA